MKRFNKKFEKIFMPSKRKKDGEEEEERATNFEPHKEIRRRQESDYFPSGVCEVAFVAHSVPKGKRRNLSTKYSQPEPVENVSSESLLFYFDGALNAPSFKWVHNEDKLFSTQDNIPYQASTERKMFSNAADPPSKPAKKRSHTVHLQDAFN
jgi:hypothetical protein